MGRGVLRGCGRVDLGSAKTLNVAGFTRHHPKEVPILAPFEGYILFSPDLGDFLCPLQPPALLARAFPAEPVPRRGTGSVCSDPPRGPSSCGASAAGGGRRGGRGEAEEGKSSPRAGAEGQLGRAGQTNPCSAQRNPNWRQRTWPGRGPLPRAGTRVLRRSGQSHCRGPDVLSQPP